MACIKLAGTEARRCPGWTPVMAHNTNYFYTYDINRQSGGFRSSGREALALAREEVLGRIREAEARRREMEEAALREKERIIQEARREAKRILEEAGVGAEAEAEERVRGAQRAVQGEKTRIVEEGKRELSLRRERASAKLKEASEFIYSEFLRRVNA